MVFSPLHVSLLFAHFFFQNCFSRRVKEVSTGQEPLPLTSNFSLHPLVLLLNVPCLEPEEVHVSFIRFPRVTTFPCLFKSISWLQGATLKAFSWIAEGLRVYLLTNSQNDRIIFFLEIKLFLGKKNMFAGIGLSWLFSP